MDPMDISFEDIEPIDGELDFLLASFVPLDLYFTLYYFII